MNWRRAVQPDAVCFLTSRDIRARDLEHSARAGAAPRRSAVATVGLSNGERVGAPGGSHSGQDWGTINVALHVDCGLSEAALLELLAIAVQARTAAVMDVNLPLAAGARHRTGTDCVAVAAPQGAGQYAGLHTDAGEAAGRAVYDAVLAGARCWMDTVRRPEDTSLRA